MNEVIELLTANNIKYTLYEHKAVLTVAQAEEIRGEIEGAHCKNLFIRDKKGKQHYLVIAKKEQVIDMNKLNAMIGNNERVSFASERRLDKYLKLQRGAVSPFGLINDTEKHVIVLIDAGLKDSKMLSFHPNVNTATVSLSFSDFEKFLNMVGNTFRYVSF